MMYSTVGGTSRNGSQAPKKIRSWFFDLVRLTSELHRHEIFNSLVFLNPDGYVEELEEGIQKVRYIRKLTMEGILL